MTQITTLYLIATIAGGEASNISKIDILMSTKLAGLLGLVFFSQCFFAFSQEKEKEDPIKVETALVSVPVVVSDRNGRYIPDLSVSDFTVLQDGKQQTIEFFAATEEPLNIALLIDTSQSTRFVLDAIKDSALSFIKLLAPKDKAMIVSFDRNVEILSALTSDHEMLRKAVKSAEIPDDEFGTALRDAAYETVVHSFAGIMGRKAIILLTDGKDAGSRISTRELLYRLQESDTMIYTVMFKTDERRALLRRNTRPGDIFGSGFPRRGDRRFPGVGRNGGGFPPLGDNRRQSDRVERQNREAAKFLQDLADTTAGRSYESDDGKLKKLFATIVEELRFQYRLGFYPPDETGERQLHEIKVRVSRRETVVRSRSSYRAISK